MLKLLFSLFLTVLKSFLILEGGSMEFGQHFWHFWFGYFTTFLVVCTDYSNKYLFNSNNKMTSRPETHCIIWVVLSACLNLQMSNLLQFSGELELPLVFVLLVITAPYQAMDLRQVMFLRGFSDVCAVRLWPCWSKSVEAIK